MPDFAATCQLKPRMLHAWLQSDGTIQSVAIDYDVISTDGSTVLVPKNGVAVAVDATTPITVPAGTTQAQLLSSWAQGEVKTAAAAEGIKPWEDPKEEAAETPAQEAAETF